MGTVKWFDPTTGEGCAVSDGGTQAALPAAALQPFGLSCIEAGVALVYDVKMESGRLIVATIHEIAGKGPNTGAPGETQRVRGRVHWFDVNKGFGFVVSKDVAGDVLLHRSVLHAMGVDALQSGAVIDFDVVWKVRGPQVARIHAVLAPDKPILQGYGFMLSLDPSSIVIDQDVVEKLKALQPRKLTLPGGSYHSQGFGFALSDDDEPAWEEAVCKWFSRPKGFGFVHVMESGEDIFVHMDLLRRAGIRELRSGQRVRVVAEQTERGLTAIDIELDADDDGAGHA
jgi:CspA family cold shock protein